MKIVYVGQFFHGRAQVLRANVLEQLGNNVIRFNMYKYEKLLGRYLNWAMKKLRIPNPSYYMMNKNLVSLAIRTKPDIVWIDKGSQIMART